MKKFVFCSDLNFVFFLSKVEDGTNYLGPDGLIDWLAAAAAATTIHLADWFSAVPVMHC